MIKKILKFTFIGILFFSIKMYSQEFYANKKNSNLPYNEIIKLDISNSIQTPVSFCSPTINTTDVYTDIAIDSFNTVYYVTQIGHLYKRDGTTSTCSYLGHFSTNPTSYYFINSLISDSGNYLYAIVSTNLYKYDISTGIFSDLGTLPSSYTSGGDLFFYENRLFLLTLTGILEINMVNPSQSCYFMDINLPNLFASFSIDYGTYSKAYIFSYNYLTLSSDMYEVNMTTKQLIGPIRTYNSEINGAASIYNLTSTNSMCTPTLSVQESIINNKYFDVSNPANKTIICKTNIKREQITRIQLFDNSGRLIKDFSNQSNIENLEVSNIPSGTYLLTLSTKNGETYTKKIIIKS